MKNNSASAGRSFCVDLNACSGSQHTHRKADVNAHRPVPKKINTVSANGAIAKASHD